MRYPGSKKGKQFAESSKQKKQKMIRAKHPQDRNNCNIKMRHLFKQKDIYTGKQIQLSNYQAEIAAVGKWRNEKKKVTKR